MRSHLQVAFVLFAILAVSTLAPTEARTWTDERVRCVHPFPCGDLWPAGLEGPFAYSTHDLDVTMDDGAHLRGTLVLPTLPDGVRAPAVIIAIPYWGTEHPRPGDPAPPGLPVWPEPWEILARNGFAVAAVNVRGSGLSDGCIGMWDERERQDMRVLVDHLATRPWSNGRVGATGLSYGGTTAYEAAIAAGPALKAIFAAVPLADPYSLHYSPQGLSNPYNDGYRAAFPVAWGQDACPEVIKNVGDVAIGPFGPRDAAYWNERDMLSRLSNATAAMFVAHGFRDGHDFQPTDVWDSIDAPKRMMIGHWGHVYPDVPGWSATFVSWFDYWLKGIGSPGPLDMVDYLVAGTGWESAAAWPPPSRALSIEVEGRFRSAPVSTLAGPTSDAEARVCTAREPDGTPLGILSTGQPLAQTTRVVGNPYVELDVSSSEEGGAINVQLVDLAPGWTCNGTMAVDVRVLSYGRADLRFHATPYEPTAFPVGVPQRVRIDLTPVGETVQAGHSLGVLLDHGHVALGLTPYWTPVLEIGPGSRMRVPTI